MWADGNSLLASKRGWNWSLILEVNSFTLLIKSSDSHLGGVKWWILELKWGIEKNVLHNISIVDYYFYQDYQLPLNYMALYQLLHLHRASHH